MYKPGKFKLATGDGGKTIAYSEDDLKRKYQWMYIPTPTKPQHIISNSFCYSLCSAHEGRFTVKRSFHDWANKERMNRENMLFEIATAQELEKIEETLKLSPYQQSKNIERYLQNTKCSVQFKRIACLTPGSSLFVNQKEKYYNYSVKIIYAEMWAKETLDFCISSLKEAELAVAAGKHGYQESVKFYKEHLERCKSLFDKVQNDKEKCIALREEM
ncbi:uncharacterized protein LOC144363035 [Saccoglossus kowalevskii]